ncbi:DMT family transporter [Halarcobacter mediterraneus]|uniref:DMT family transporter n=1 Tax=Halarcobacter mediterraneus TaxID=2023153 RepID=UPI001E657414|nr:DMT family transporter [Halarcobacter mediterraneus]
MTHNNSIAFGHFYIFLATVLIGGSFIAVENLAGLINPFSLILLRFLISAIILSPFVLFRQKLRRQVIPTLKRGAIISLFYAGFFILQLIALEDTTALNTGALYTLTPLLTALFSIFFFKDKISIKQYSIFFLAVISTCGVIFKGSLDLLLSFSLNEGDLVFFISMILMAFYSIVLKLFQKNEAPIVMVFSILLGGSFWMFLILILFDIPLNWSFIKGRYAFDIGYLIIMTTLLTLYLYQKATAVLNPKIIMSYIYLNPAIVAILVAIFNGIVLDYIVWIFIFISCISTVLLQYILHQEKKV